MAVEHVCTTCGEMKTDFAKGWKCRDCHKQYCRDYYYANRTDPRRRKKMPTEEAKARRRAAAYLRRYSITEAQRDAMLAEQGGACAICRSTEPNGPAWCTDHDHECCSYGRSCGECIRGILCFRCNTLLGHAKDNIETLRTATEYLEKWGAGK